MTTNATTKASKPTKTVALAQYADKAVPPLMLEFCAWLEAETGVPVDARSVYLGSALREKFQKSRRNAKTAVLESIVVPAKAKAPAKPARKKAAPVKAATTAKASA